MATDVTFRTYVSAFTDFVTVATHTILYERGIYPSTSFLSAKKYEFPVRQNRHPKVCEWINDAVDAAELELLKGTVDRLAIVIYSQQNVPLERFVFDVSRFPQIPLTDIDVPLQQTTAEGGITPTLPIVDLEEQLRATMSKLCNCSSTLKPLPSGCTFTLAIELKGEGQAPIGHPQPWVPAQHPNNHDNDTSRPKLKTTAVRTVQAGDLVFECWIEVVGHQPSQSLSPDISGPS